MVKLKSLTGVKNRIVLNLIELDEQNASFGVKLDDAVIAVWEALVYLDYKELNAKDSKLHHFSSMSHVPAAKMSRFRSYTREALHEALRKERLVNLTSSIDKERVLSDLKVIDRIDNHETVVLNESLKEIYKQHIKAQPWIFGIEPYGEIKCSRSKRMKIGSESVGFTVDQRLEETLAPFIEDYIADWDYVVERERYKWDAVLCFKENFSFNAENFAVMLNASLSKTDNLLSGSMFFAREILLRMVDDKPEDVKACFRDLYDETIGIADRMTHFLQTMKRLFEIQKAHGVFKEKESYQQSSRAVSVYLSLFEPGKHYLYMETMYQDFLKTTGIKRSKLGRTESVLLEYENDCNELRKILLKNDKLIALHDMTYSDISDYHLLTQDFLFYIYRHYPNLHPEKVHIK